MLENTILTPKQSSINEKEVIQELDGGLLPERRKNIIQLFAILTII